MKVVDGQPLVSSCRSRLISALVVVALLGIAAGAASAEEAATRPNYARDGAYMGARGIYGVSYFAKEVSGDISVEDRFAGFALQAGYRFREIFAVEVDFEIMDPGYRVVTADDPDTAELDPSALTLRSLAMTAYAKMYPLSLLPKRNNWTDRFQPYLKMGPGFQYYYQKGGNPDDIGFAARFGGGVEYYLSNRLAVTFDAVYTLTTGSIEGLNSVSLGFIGFQWRFAP